MLEGTDVIAVVRHHSREREYTCGHPGHPILERPLVPVANEFCSFRASVLSSLVQSRAEGFAFMVNVLFKSTANLDLIVVQV